MIDFAFSVALSQFWINFRLGPSASQTAPDAPEDDKINEIVKAVSLLQSVLSQPWAQKVMNQLGGVAAIDPGVANAHGGAPSSSKPGVLAKPTDTSKETDASNVKPGPVNSSSVPANSSPSPSSVPGKSNSGNADAKPADSEPPTAPDVGLINSSTHRAAHARLARRMAALTPGECPNMVRLWEGTRKDPTKLFFFQTKNNIFSARFNHQNNFFK